MDTFATLADPNRRTILDALKDRPCTVNALVTRLRISQPAVSKHLKVLRGAGLVSVRPEGQRRWYELNVTPLQDVDRWLEPYRRFWAANLDALERHLDQTNTDDQQGDSS